MRGEVLHYDEAQGFGFITGADGNRYTFARENLRRDFPVSKGTVVEFQPGGGQARDIFSIRTETPAAPITAAPPAPAQHFGRSAPFATPEGSGTGLFDYFWRGMTVNYANFQGRARRKEYWGFALFSYLGLIALTLAAVALDSSLGNLDGSNAIPLATILVGVVFVLASIIPWIAMSVRRQHDIGLSGWFYLVIFIPSIGTLILLVFALIPSQKRENKWGPAPAGIPADIPFIPPAPQA